MSLAQKSFIPVYQRLFQEYRDAIITRKLLPGDRIDSINQIMRLHGVSRETAKLVLHKLAGEGYIVQHLGKGSFVADLGPRKRIWGVILPFYSAQYEHLVYELSRQAWLMGRQLRHFVDYHNWEEEVRLVGKLVNERYEGIIVVPTLDESRTAEFYRGLSSRETNITLVDHTMAGSYFGYVVQSYDLGVQRGTRYLLENTSRCIAFVRNELWAGRNMVQELMEGTFVHAMSEMRPEAMPHLIDRSSRIDAAFVRDYGIDGIFCCDDSDAIRVIGRLRDSGVRVPEEVRLVSYGNTHLARFFTPRITSLDPHNQQMAEKIAQILKKRIEGESTHFCQYVVQPELAVRDT
jgi:DNA-binding LacI/PurR family transcriptional regulator